jgi:hypothetical protein
MNQVQTPRNIDNIKTLIGKTYQEGDISDYDLVQIIELCGCYLNPLTISDYARKEGISYNGAKKHPTVNIFGIKFIFNNK